MGGSVRRHWFVLPVLVAVMLLFEGCSIDIPWPGASSGSTDPVSGSPGARPAGSVIIPDVINTVLPKAEQTLSDAGLRYEVVTQISNRPDGRVLSVTPAPGRTVPKGTIVTVHEAITIVPVPNLAGMTVSAARDALTRAGLAPHDQALPNTRSVRSDLVEGQLPQAGQQVRHGADVLVRYYQPVTVPASSAPGVPSPSRRALPSSIPSPSSAAALASPPPGASPSVRPSAAAMSSTSPSVSSASPSAKPSGQPGASPSATKVTVPTVVGQPESAAATALRQAGLPFETISEQRADIEDGTVLDVKPPGGAQVLPGTSVTLRVAVATVAVPNIVGMSQADASAAITNAGLVPQLIALPNTDAARNGRVAEQEPPAGNSLRDGGHVTIRVYEQVAPPPGTAPAVPPASQSPDAPSPAVSPQPSDPQPTPPAGANQSPN